MTELRDLSKMEPSYAKKYLEAMYRVKIPYPQKKHVIASKLAGGFMTFWMLWRAKHDWHSLFVNTLFFLVNSCIKSIYIKNIRLSFFLIFF